MSGAGKFTAHGSVKPNSIMLTEHAEKAAVAAFSIFRLYQNPDLRERNEGLLPEKHKRQWIVVIGELLHRMQILRQTVT